MVEIDFGGFEEFGCNYFRSGSEAVDVYEQSFHRVELQEQLGFRYHFIVEHQSNNVGQCQATVYLAALAQRTSTIRIGAMIFLLPFYNPMRLAQDAAMIDQLSRGRLEFGAGSGVFEHEFQRWNLPYSERRAMGLEALEIIKKAWTEESVTYEGKYWNFDEAIPLPRPYQKPHPPIWYLGRSNETLEYAAAHNYPVGIFLQPELAVAERMNLWRQLWKDARHKGPMPRVLLVRHVYVAETDAQAREEAAPYLVKAYTYGDDRIKRTRAKLQETSPQPGGLIGGSDAPYQKRFGDQMAHNMTTGLDFWLESGLAHVGSPETVIRGLERQHQLIGFNVLASSFRWGGLPDELAERSIKLFGEKVMPAFSPVPEGAVTV